MTHGTTGYRQGCRCGKCRAAACAYVLAWQRRNGELRRQPPAHGTVNGYCNYRCRCGDCREAYRLYQREYRGAS